MFPTGPEFTRIETDRSETCPALLNALSGTRVLPRVPRSDERDETRLANRRAGRCPRGEMSLFDLLFPSENNTHAHRRLHLTQY
jgi:hypothetical protein